MLSNFEKDIVELIKCSLSGETPKIDEAFDFEKAYDFAQERQITPLIYFAAADIPRFADTVAVKKFFKSTADMSYYCLVQNELINRVSEAFKKNKISHLLLKGAVIREMYPRLGMRFMTDADILIKEEEYSKIIPLMTELGFVEKYESDHEYVWRNGGFSIELHKRLVPSYNKDYNEYFGDSWKLATIKDEKTCEYKMSIEDNFVYSFVHYAMHYRNGGIGVKHVIDFYVIMQKNPELDFRYIEKELEKLQLLKFWQNTKKLLDVWFCGAEATELTDFMTAKIFDSGAFGTAENHVFSEAVRTSNVGKGIKIKRLVSLIVPPYFAMCQKYRFLRKMPVALPFMWIFRWFHLLFTPSKIKARKKELDMLSSDGVNKYQNELDYVGLRFNFD